ncbi:Latisemin [Dactylellina cionopaga]|nr:Latisemin [Dactylellina cionopaga]
MKGVKCLIVLISILSNCITVGLAVSIPRDTVILGPAVEVVDGQHVWSEGSLISDPSFNASHPTATLALEYTKIRGRQAAAVSVRPTPTAYTSREGKFSRDMLKITNDLRAIHGSPPLVWNKVLATYASRQARKCDFKHSHGPYGENLAGGGPMNNPVWYQWYLYTEIKNYNYNKPGFSSSTGHFTQLIWKASKEIGCAWVAGCSNLAYQVWCEYTPAGNVSPTVNYVNNVARPRRDIPAAPPTYDPYYK